MSGILNTISLGNCLNLLKGLADDSIDCCVTDPPYGIRFMGKKWDYEIPAVEIWREVLRVLKPGAHILVACGTRTQHRMVVNIEDAGFEIRDVICWHYGQGFPKSLDVSKAIDKSAGAERQIIGSKGLHKFNDTRDREDHKYGADKRTFEQADALTAPATEEAKQWSGWGTALKPATEFWTLARKPFPGSVAQNVLKHGTAGLNIDACRIESQDIEAGKEYTQKRLPTGNNVNKSGTWVRGAGITEKYTGVVKDGRFPSNVVLDEFTAGLIDEQSGELTSGRPCGTDDADTKSRNTYGKFAGGRELTGFGDRGEANERMTAERGLFNDPDRYTTGPEYE